MSGYYNILGELPAGGRPLVTLSFFHGRPHLARRMCDTLLESECPRNTLHIYLVDRAPFLLPVLRRASSGSGREVLFVEQTEEIPGNPYHLHMNKAREILSSVDFDHIAIVDSDFELRSDWHKGVMELTGLLEEDPSARLFTAFNNSTGTNWRAGTERIREKGGVLFSEKTNCGSGHVLMSRETFFELGEMFDDRQDVAWMEKANRNGWKTISTLPSRAQHLGVYSSELHAHPHWMGDSALDFSGDYMIDPCLCGNWRGDATGPFQIHLNGLVTKERGLLLRNIAGHVSANADGTFDITFEDLCFQGVSPDNDRRVLSSAGARFPSLDTPSFKLVGKESGYYIVWSEGLYWAVSEFVSQESIAQSHGELRRKAIKSCSSLPELENFLKSCAAAKLVDEDYMGYQIHRLELSFYAVAHSHSLASMLEPGSTNVKKSGVEGDLCFKGESEAEVRGAIDRTRRAYNPRYTSEARLAYHCVLGRLSSLAKSRGCGDIAIYCAGRHTRWLLFCFADHPLIRRVREIVDDKGGGGELRGLPVVSPEKRKAKTVLVSTDVMETFREVERSLKSSCPECEVIDLYWEAPKGPFVKYWTSDWRNAE